MKKSILKVLLIVSIIAISFVSGVLASSNFEEITAYLNKGVSMTWNGEPFYVYEEDGTMLYPISYKGRNYIPARFIAEKSGVKVGWNAEEFSITFTDPDYVEENVVKGTYTKIGSGNVRILDDMSYVTESGFNVKETLPYDEKGIHVIKLSWATGDIIEKRMAHILFANTFCKEMKNEFNEFSFGEKENGHINGVYKDKTNSLRIDIYTTDEEIVMTAQIL